MLGSCWCLTFKFVCLQGAEQKKIASLRVELRYTSIWMPTYTRWKPSVKPLSATPGRLVKMSQWEVDGAHSAQEGLRRRHIKLLAGRTITTLLPAWPRCPDSTQAICHRLPLGHIKGACKWYVDILSDIIMMSSDRYLSFEMARGEETAKDSAVLRIFCDQQTKNQHQNQNVHMIACNKCGGS